MRRRFLSLFFLIVFSGQQAAFAFSPLDHERSLESEINSYKVRISELDKEIQAKKRQIRRRKDEIEGKGPQKNALQILQEGVSLSKDKFWYQHLSGKSPSQVVLDGVTYSEFLPVVAGSLTRKGASYGIEQAASWVAHRPDTEIPSIRRNELIAKYNQLEKELKELEGGTHPQSPKEEKGKEKEIDKEETSRSLEMLNSIEQKKQTLSNTMNKLYDLGVDVRKEKFDEAETRFHKAKGALSAIESPGYLTRFFSWISPPDQNVQEALRLQARQDLEGAFKNYQEALRDYVHSGTSTGNARRAKLQKEYDNLSRERSKEKGKEKVYDNNDLAGQKEQPKELSKQQQERFELLRTILQSTPQQTAVAAEDKKNRTWGEWGAQWGEDLQDSARRTLDNGMYAGLNYLHGSFDLGKGNGPFWTGLDLTRKCCRFGTRGALVSFYGFSGIGDPKYVSFFAGDSSVWQKTGAGLVLGADFLLQSLQKNELLREKLKEDYLAFKSWKQGTSLEKPLEIGEKVLPGLYRVLTFDPLSFLSKEARIRTKQGLDRLYDSLAGERAPFSEEDKERISEIVNLQRSSSYQKGMALKGSALTLVDLLFDQKKSLSMCLLEPLLSDLSQQNGFVRRWVGSEKSDGLFLLGMGFYGSLQFKQVTGVSLFPTQTLKFLEKAPQQDVLSQAWNGLNQVLSFQIGGGSKWLAKIAYDGIGWGLSWGISSVAPWMPSVGLTSVAQWVPEGTGDFLKKGLETVCVEVLSRGITLSVESAVSYAFDAGLYSWVFWGKQSERKQVVSEKKELKSEIKLLKQQKAEFTQNLRRAEETLRKLNETLTTVKEESQKAAEERIKETQVQEAASTIETQIQEDGKTASAEEKTPL